MFKEKINLADQDRQSMKIIFQILGYKDFHGCNVLKWIHKHGIKDFDRMTNLSKKLREYLKDIAEIYFPTIIFDQLSKDGTHKWLLKLKDSQCIETIYIPNNHRGTLCLSSQVGCALDCSFCFTTQQGFNRNLTVSEIIGQIWAVKKKFRGKYSLTNIVLMGMGEPLANTDTVITAINIMQDNLAYMVPKNRITLSTSGIIPGLRKLLNKQCNVNLAISLHAPNNTLRSKLVPVNQKYPLEKLIPVCKEFLQGKKRQKITWEYVMLSGINDTDEHAKELSYLLKDIPSKINLIPFNSFTGTPYRSSSLEKIELFRQKVIEQLADMIVTIRKRRGYDINAACGQLIGQVNNRRR